MSLVIQRAASGVWVFSGSLDKNTLSELAQHPVHVSIPDGLGCQFDFKGLTYIDSAGLAFCMQQLKRLLAMQKSLEIYGSPVRLYALMKAQGLEPLLGPCLQEKKS